MTLMFLQFLLSLTSPSSTLFRVGVGRKRGGCVMWRGVDVVGYNKRSKHKTLFSLTFHTLRSFDCLQQSATTHATFLAPIFTTSAHYPLTDSLNKWRLFPLPSRLPHWWCPARSFDSCLTVSVIRKIKRIRNKSLAASSRREVINKSGCSSVPGIDRLLCVSVLSKL